MSGSLLGNRVKWQRGRAADPRSRLEDGDLDRDRAEEGAGLGPQDQRELPHARHAAGGAGSRLMRVVDSHTEGEPTRIIVEGGPDLGKGPLSERRARFARDFDEVRSFCVNEPRGYGPGRRPPLRAGRSGMRSRHHLLQQCRRDRHVRPWHHRPRGDAGAFGPHRAGVAPHRDAGRRGERRASVEERGTRRQRAEPARRQGRCRRGAGPRPRPGRRGLGRQLVLPDGGCDDPAERHPYRPADGGGPGDPGRARRGRIKGDDGGRIDHIELFGPPAAGGNARSFVLCPGGAYDRSPCGTGTSAKLACLAADGKLPPAGHGSRKA